MTPALGGCGDLGKERSLTLSPETPLSVWVPGSRPPGHHAPSEEQGTRGVGGLSSSPHFPACWWAWDPPLCGRGSCLWVTLWPRAGAHEASVTWGRCPARAGRRAVAVPEKSVRLNEATRTSCQGRTGAGGLEAPSWRLGDSSGRHRHQQKRSSALNLSVLVPECDLEERAGPPPSPSLPPPSRFSSSLPLAHTSRQALFWVQPHECPLAAGYL